MVSVYNATATNEGLFELADRRNQEAALTWAKTTGAKYAVAGSVDEWRYKVGLDGEPATGISLNVIDLTSGQVYGVAVLHAQVGAEKPSVPSRKKPSIAY